MKHSAKPSKAYSLLRIGGIMTALSAIAGLALYETYLPPAKRCSKTSCKHVPWALLLGCAVHDDGTPSSSLLGRVEQAIDLYDKGFYDTLIVSGGAVQNSYVEADCMEQLIHERRPDLPVIPEREARNTWQNMEFSKKYIQDVPVIIITGNLHCRRASAIARQFFKNFCMAGYPDFKWHRARKEAASRVLYIWIELKKAFGGKL